VCVEIVLYTAVGTARYRYWLEACTVCVEIVLYTAVGEQDIGIG